MLTCWLILTLVWFSRDLLYLCMAMDLGKEERTAFSPDSSAHCHTSLIEKWRWRLMLGINSHANKLCFSVLYICLGFLKEGVCRRQDLRTSDSISRPNAIFWISSWRIMIYGSQKLKRQHQESGHRTRMPATKRTIEIKKNCSFTFNHSKNIYVGIVWNGVSNLPKMGSLLSKISLFSRANRLINE